MSRLARLIIPGLPHHVTQRGNGRQKVFFSDADYDLYLRLLAENCKAAGVEIWAFCLMPNHIHAILVPADEDGLRTALAPPTAAMPVWSTPGANAPDISGRAAMAVP